MNIHALLRKNGQIVRDVLGQFSADCYWNVSGDGFLKIIATIAIPFSGDDNPLEQVIIEFPVPIVRSGGEIDVPKLQEVVGAIVGLCSAVSCNARLLRVFGDYQKSMERIGMALPPTLIEFQAPKTVVVKSLAFPMSAVPLTTSTMPTTIPFRIRLLQALHIAAYRAQLLGIGGE